MTTAPLLLLHQMRNGIVPTQWLRGYAVNVIYACLCREDSSSFDLLTVPQRTVGTTGTAFPRKTTR